MPGKGQKRDETDWEPEMRNYKDGPEGLAEGRMFPLSMSEARKRFPVNNL